MKKTKEQIFDFLKRVDKLFPISLSEKQNLTDFADKLNKMATIITEEENGRIVAAVFGYTDQVTDNLGYISIVATTPEYQGKGIASKLIKDFLCFAAEKHLKAVHLYAVPTNITAVNMYKRIGFVEWNMPNELRPEDLHLIYYLNNGVKE